MMLKKPLIYFLCTGNSCRSQMAAGFARVLGKGKIDVYSAGIETHGLNPRAVAAMKDAGIDISHQTSDNIRKYKNVNFDFIITVCDNAKERCPFFPGKAKKFHHNFPDPAKASGTENEILQQFREVRELIKSYCKEFAADNL